MTETLGRNDVFALKPAEYYLSEDIFTEEYRKVFSHDWIYVAHVSHFPEVGSYIKLPYGGEELVCTRGEGGSFYAHFNVCPHRGARICSENSGNARQGFVCPYHKWHFAMDGSLKNVPQMRNGEYFDYSDHALKTAHADVWNGMVFVHLGQREPEPLAKRMEPYDNVAEKFDPAGAKLVHEETFQIAANWKIVVENGLECYHCPGNHKSLARVIDVAALQAEMGEWMQDEDQPETLGNPQRLRAGIQSCSKDGTLITEKLLGKCTADDHGIAGGIAMMPNPSYIAFYVDHFWTISIRPLSAQATELVYSWFVRDDAEEGRDFDMTRLVEVGHITQVEDKQLCEMTQSGLRSRHYVPGPIVSKVEPGIRDFLLTYAELMD